MRDSSEIQTTVFLKHLLAVQCKHLLHSFAQKTRFQPNIIRIIINITKQRPLGSSEPTGLGADLPFLGMLRAIWLEANELRERICCCHSAELLLIFAFPCRDG